MCTDYSDKKYFSSQPKISARIKENSLKSEYFGGKGRFYFFVKLVVALEVF